MDYENFGLKMIHSFSINSVFESFPVYSPWHEREFKILFINLELFEHMDSVSPKIVNLNMDSLIRGFKN